MSLPSTYRRLTYIQSSGTQYINSGYYPKAYCSFETAVMPNNSEYGCIFGCTTGDNNSRYYLLDNHSSNRVDYVYCSNYSAVSVTLSQNSVNTIKLEYGKITINGVQTTFSCQANDSSLSLYILANHCGGVINEHFSGKLYYLRIYENTNLVRDFIPCERVSDSVLGLYDDVNGVFYTNGGSGTFIKGDYVLETSVNPQGSGTIVESGSGNNHILTPTPSSTYAFTNWLLKGYTQLEYIESTGTQYIDTGIIPTSSTKIEYVSKFNRVDIAQGQGCISGSGTYSRFHTLVDTYKNAFFLGYTNTFIEATLDTNSHRYILDAKNGYVQFDETRTNVTIGNMNLTDSYCIFARKFNNSMTSYCYQDLPYLKIWNDNALVRNYIPVIRHSDGQIGMLDLVHFKFYGNAGTGVFTGGSL